MKASKNIRKFLPMSLTLVMLCLSFSAHHILIGKCRNEDSCHIDSVIHRCNYTQEDLQRAFSKTPERYQPAVCFYCGCSIDDHTSLIKKKKRPTLSQAIKL